MPPGTAMMAKNKIKLPGETERKEDDEKDKDYDRMFDYDYWMPEEGTFINVLWYSKKKREINVLENHVFCCDSFGGF